MRSICRQSLSIFALAAAATLFATADLAAQDRPYTEGSVWDVTYVKTEPGQYNAYLSDLQRVWKQVNDAAVEKGYVLSYRILSAPAGHPGDWDLMLMVEYPNMASFDKADERFDPLVERVIGNLDDQSSATVERSRLRVIQGSKLAREITLR